MQTPQLGLGYIPDHRFLRTQMRSHALVGTSPTPPKSGSLESSEGEIVDQGASGSCTFGGTAQALFTGFNAAKKPLPFFPSPATGYRLVRILERKNASMPLQDGGAMPADILTVLSRFGIRAMQGPTPDGRNYDIWTPDDLVNMPANSPPPNVNTEPTLTELETSGTTIITGQYRVDENSFDMITQICAAISGFGRDHGLAVGIGVFVDSAVMNWTPNKGPLDAPPNFNDPNGGGHWLCLDSYDSYANGEAGLLRGPNSWGKSYGDKGHYEVTSKWLRSTVSDIIIFNTEVAT